MPPFPSSAATIPPMNILHWRIVLVRPRNPLNIGAAARAMANFGLSDLRVVAPFEPTWEEVRTSAVGGAETVIKSARAVPSLIDAIGDASLVVGTTTGSRRNPGRELIPLPEIDARLSIQESSSVAAILFGGEKTGLSNDDLSHCHALVRIPTSPACPSMNLGQSVAVIAYELSRAVLPTLPTPTIPSDRSEPANEQSLAHIFERAVRVLDASGYFQPDSRAAMLLKLRQFLLGLNLSCNDARIMGGVLSQIEWKLTAVSKVQP
jgi:TrmH family RNA methyltransferase